ncbi:MAG: TonB C-terminal domain-containing protein [Gammaproteobacteria bacterium]|nr:TonB C-terminal domain-containing protein [Gammaproteobacteria bacterium]
MRSHVEHRKGTMRAKILTILSIAGLLAGCATAPAVPYWQNPGWVNSLATAVKHNVKYPHSAAAQDSPSGTAIVTFIYYKGNLLEPHVVQSTGSSVLDGAITEQIAKIKPPQAAGSDTDTPHAFQMTIPMSPVSPSLRLALRQALAEHIQYPIMAERYGSSGLLIAYFEYKNGEILNPKIQKSSGNISLDQAVLNELRATALPKPPDWLKNKTFGFNIPYCFGLLTCANTVTQVRYVSTGESSSLSKPPCAVVGYEYKNGAFSNIHLIKSSGDADWDKHAVAEAAQGKLPEPPARFDRAVSDYTVPVCSNSSLDAAPASPHPD